MTPTLHSTSDRIRARARGWISRAPCPGIPATGAPPSESSGNAVRSVVTSPPQVVVAPGRPPSVLTLFRAVSSLVPRLHAVRSSSAPECGPGHAPHGALPAGRSGAPCARPSRLAPRARPWHTRGHGAGTRVYRQGHAVLVVVVSRRDPHNADLPSTHCCDMRRSSTLRPVFPRHTAGTAWSKPPRITTSVDWARSRSRLTASHCGGDLFQYGSTDGNPRHGLHGS